MALTICTGWSPAGWQEYAHRFVDGFTRFWPADVRLIAFVEEIVPLPAGRHVIEQRLLSEIPGAAEFIQRHRKTPERCGRAPVRGWKDKEVAAGYSFRFDAVKFARMAFITHAAALEVGDGVMAWFDADVVTHAAVPPGFVEGLLGEADICYLGREPKHSEIGFTAYRLPAALPMLWHYRETYHTDAVFGLPEWHSAYVWDVARLASGAKARNLTPGGHGHVWFQSPLARYTDHLKGKRKSRGSSKERG